MQRPVFREHRQPPGEQIYHLITSIYLHLLEGEDRLFERLGVERNVFWALWHIGRTPQGVSMTELSKAIWSDKSTITHLIDRLEKAGLARRSMHPEDRRVKTLVLTAQGREFTQRLIEAHQQLIARLLPADAAALQGTTLEQLIELEDHMRTLLSSEDALDLLVPAPQKDGAEPETTAPSGSRR